METNEDLHKKTMVSHEQLLWKIVSSVEKIEGVLIGSAYTNNKGLVHRVEAQGDMLSLLDDRVAKLEDVRINEEKSSKKNHSLIAIAISGVAALAAIFAAVVAYSPKK